ncbi:hypothetical protein [Nonomuraea dietziae]|uniref:hypothetical protein n=1 Tax=Nonomuraea dietziae TaxID=65515 RepID=UPI0031DCEA73
MICSDDSERSAPCHHGAVACVTVSGRANGRPPSGRVTVCNQSHSSAARGLGACSNTSKACSAEPGWLSGERRSGSRPQPYPPSALR